MNELASVNAYPRDESNSIIELLSCIAIAYVSLPRPSSMQTTNKIEQTVAT